MATPNEKPEPLRYQSRKDGRRRESPWSMTWPEVALVFAGVLLIIVAANYAFDRAARVSPAVKCASNLHQIGLAIQKYANDHGTYPDALPELMRYVGSSTQIFVCPSSKDTAASGPTTQAAAANLTAGGHLSYVYVGAGLTTATVTSTTVLAYEPVGNHKTGSNVLFGDGHISTVPAALLPTLLKSGTTRPATAPSLP